MESILRGFLFCLNFRWFLTGWVDPGFGQEPAGRELLIGRELQIEKAGS
jgi:hypothetical protein